MVNTRWVRIPEGSKGSPLIMWDEPTLPSSGFARGWHLQHRGGDNLEYFNDGTKDAPVWVLAGAGASSVDADETRKGVARLSVAPTSATDPVAAGSNDPRITGAVQGNDPRLSDARNPLSHTHGIDDLPVADDGVSDETSVVRSNDSRLGANTGPVAIDRLPIADSGEASTTEVVRADDARLSDARNPITHAHNIGDLPVASDGENSTTEIVRADDSRLSDSRSPVGHSHVIEDLPVADSGVSDPTRVVRSDDSRLAGGGVLDASDIQKGAVLLSVAPADPASPTAVGDNDTRLEPPAIEDLPVATSGTSSATQIVRADDSRLSNSRPPLSHGHVIGDLPVASDGESSASKVPRSNDSRITGAAKAADLANATDAAKGDALVGFRQSGAGAVTRTVHDKLSEIPSVDDYGASPSKTPVENRTAIQAALDANAGKTVLIPFGEYKIDTLVYLPSNTTLLLYGTLRNNTISATFRTRDAVIGMGTYHLQATDQLTLYAAGSAAAGARTLTLDPATSATALASLAVGDTLYVRSKTHVVTVGQLPTYATLTKIEAIDTATGVLTLAHPFDEAVADVMVAKANRPDIATDVYAPGLYACYRGAVVGPGRLVSDSYAVISRGGMLECTVDVGGVEGLGGWYANMICHSRLFARNVRARWRGQEIAQNSNNSHFGAVSLSYSPTTNSGVPLMSFGENARKNRAEYGTVEAGGFTDSGGSLRFSTGVRDNSYRIDNLIAPNAPGAGILFANDAQTVSGDQVQHATEDNSVILGRALLGSGSYHIFAGNAGGQNRRNRVERGRITGAVSANAALMEGSDHEIGSGVTCEAGNLFLSANVTRLKSDGAYFEGGITYAAGVPVGSHRLTNTRNASQGRAKAASRQGQPGTVASTTPNNTLATMTFPANTLLPGDEIHLFVAGKTNGVNGTKKIQVRDDLGVVFDIDFAAAESGTFQAEGRIFVLTDAVMRGNVSELKVSAPTLAPAERTGLTLAASGRTFTLEAWVANAADSISLFGYRMGLRRAGEDVL